MPPNLAARNCFFVNYVGTDDPGYNAIGAPQPYLSVGAALAALAAVANPPSATNPWTIAVGPGVFNELGFELPPWVWITGSADDESSNATQINIAGDITLHPAWSNAVSRGGISNLIIRASSGNPKVDFTMPAPITGNPSRILDFTNIRFDRSLSWEGTGTADVIRVFGVVNDGDRTLQTINFVGGRYETDDLISAVPVQAKDSSTLSTTGVMQSTFISTPAGFLAEADTHAVSVSIYASKLGTLGMIQSGSGILGITADAISIPARASVSIVGTGTLTRLSDAYGEGYTPSIPGDWPVPVPATVQQALDDLILNSGSMPPSNQIVVDQIIGSDSTGNGAPISPFQTIGAAIAQIIANGDNSLAKPYTVIVHPGVYSENINILPFVWIIGCAYSSAFSVNFAFTNIAAPTQLNGNINCDPTFGSNGHRGGVVNLGQVGGNTFLQPGVSGNCCVDLIGCSLLNTGTQFQNNPRGGVNWIAGSANDTVLTHGIYQIMGVNIFGVLDIEGSCVVDLFGLSTNEFSGTPANVVVGQNDGSTSNVRICASDIQNLTVNGASISVSVDASSYPDGTLTIQNGGIFTVRTPAPAIGYVPGTPADWAGTPPADVQEALDRLAAVATTPP